MPALVPGVNDMSLNLFESRLISANVYDFSYKTVWNFARLGECVRFFVQNRLKLRSARRMCTIFRTKPFETPIGSVNVYDFSYKTVWNSDRLGECVRFFVQNRLKLRSARRMCTIFRTKPFETPIGSVNVYDFSYKTAW